jgi:hypothetical protein
MLQLMRDESSVQFLEMPPVVSNDHTGLSCGENQLFLIAFAQHTSVSRGEYVKPSSGEYLSQDYRYVFV